MRETPTGLSKFVHDGWIATRPDVYSGPRNIFNASAADSLLHKFTIL